jgi:hypothetical protein
LPGIARTSAPPLTNENVSAAAIAETQAIRRAATGAGADAEAGGVVGEPG